MTTTLVESRALIREFPFECRAEGDGLTLEGYAAVFDSPTRIDSWEGSFTETIARGAFKKTLQERTPVLMFNHGQHPLIGDMPLGVITHAREDDHGVFIRARLAGNWLIDPVREAIANRSIQGMSFRFEPVRESWSKDRSRRTLQEVRVPEVGPVVFPAYGDTSVGVRSAEAIRLLSDVNVRHDLARWLMRDIGNTVLYADSGFLADGQPRFPLDTTENVQAAWDAIHSPDRDPGYDDSEIEQMEQVILSVAPNFGLRLIDEDDMSMDGEPGDMGTAPNMLPNGAMVEGMNSAPVAGAVREDTQADGPPASQQEPASTTPATTRRERLLAVARLKGHIQQ